MDNERLLSDEHAFDGSKVLFINLSKIVSYYNNLIGNRLYVVKKVLLNEAELELH